MNSKDGIERINVLKPKEKDFEAWKVKQPYYNMKEDSFLRKCYEKNIANEEELKKIGVNEIKICPICKKETETEKKVMPEFQYLDYYCEPCIKEKEENDEKKKKEADQKKREERTENEIKDRRVKYLTSVPPRYSDLNDSTNEKLIKADCSILYGGFGTGKTWESYSLIKYLYCNLKIDSYKLITEAGLINYLKAGFNNNSFEDRINDLKETDLLVVDEMGKSNDSDFNKAQLFEILNYRYDWMKKTVLICNCLEKSELVDILNPAITDRFRECIIEMSGQSKRYKQELEDMKI